jgi:hypothetical protein
MDSNYIVDYSMRFGTQDMQYCTMDLLNIVVLDMQWNNQGMLLRTADLHCIVD